MGDFGIKRNASGYYDETAFLALKDMVGSEIKAGDIWQDKDGREFLVIRHHEKFSTTLLLNEESKRSGEICVTSRALRYTHPGMLQYTFDTLMKTFIKKMPEEEFLTVINAVSESLDVTTRAEKEETDTQDKRIAELEKKNRMLAERAAKAETELEERGRSSAGDGAMWKAMYENLLDKLVGRLRSGWAA